MFFSGASGRVVVEAYTRMVQDFNAEDWDQCSLTPVEKQAHCSGLLDSMCDAEQRLVQYYLQPKFIIFDVCTKGSYDMRLIKSVCDPMMATVAECQKCVDRVFTQRWAQRLLSANVSRSRRAHRVLCGILIVASNNSTKCERLHLFE